MTMKGHSAKEYFLFGESWVLLALARLMLLFMPFKNIIPILGKVQPSVRSQKNSGIQNFTLISTAIARASRYGFWRTRCFEQALAAKMMLKRRGMINTIYFGVHKNMESNNISAHAWLECDGTIITGAKNADQYQVIGVFKG